jgi:hypothetical protein
VFKVLQKQTENILVSMHALVFDVFPKTLDLVEKTH